MFPFPLLCKCSLHFFKQDILMYTWTLIKVILHFYTFALAVTDHIQCMFFVYCICQHTGHRAVLCSYCMLLSDLRRRLILASFSIGSMLFSALFIYLFIVNSQQPQLQMCFSWKFPRLSRKPATHFLQEVLQNKQRLNLYFCQSYYFDMQWLKSSISGKIITMVPNS